MEGEANYVPSSPIGFLDRAATVAYEESRSIIYEDMTYPTNVVRVCYMDQKKEMTWNSILEQPIVPSSGDAKYLTPLWVSGNVEPCEQFHQSDPSGSEPCSDSLYHREIMYKIRAALKILAFREQHVLVQFWSPRVAGKHQLLTTMDEPFGLGVASEELCFYRRDSEHKVFLVDKDHEEEEDLSPPARVFRRGLPEWTSDLTNYEKKDFPQLDCAIRCNLHGYLALPVFDPTSELCVGVLELLTCSKLKDFAYEVDHIHGVLKAGNLTSPQVFEVVDGPASNVSNKRRKTELDQIYYILKCVCDTHGLPLAQTWVVSLSTSYFAHEKVLEKSCGSFNTRCFRKVCMTTAVPYYVRDMSTWKFIEASKERHLEMSRGVAGRALSTRGSCFCGDVTQLDEEEYPLVHNARVSGLTSCFAIFLHSVEGNNDYVLEFFLPLGTIDSRHVPNLVQTLKQNITDASGFELGDGSSLEVVGSPADMSENEMDSSDLESSVVTDPSGTLYANVVDHQCSSTSTNVSIERICDNFTDLTVNVTFKGSSKQFIFRRFSGLSEVVNKVAKRFKLEGQGGLRLKYMDEDNDLITISCDDAWESATSGSSIINLIYEKANI